MKLMRIDRGRVLRRPKRTDEGFVLVEGYAAKPGVYSYRMPDGTTVRELVTDEVLLDAAASLARKPVTLGHPPELVSPDNVQQHGVGAIGEEIVHDDGWSRVKCIVNRRDAITALEQGVRELSCGYLTKIDQTPGVWTDELGRQHHYDQRQTERTYNHLALVPRGRHGSDVGVRIDSQGGLLEVAIQTDSDDDTQRRTDAAPPTKRRPMYRIRIDGVEYEIEDGALARAIQDGAKRLDEMNGKLAATVAERDEMKAKLDEAEGKLAAADAKVAELEAAKLDEAAIEARIAARADLLETAEKAGVKRDDCAGKSDAEVRQLIVSQRYPTVKLDGASDAYLDGLYQAAVADLATTQANEQQRRDRLADPVRGAAPPANGGEQRRDYDDVARDYARNYGQGWATPKPAKA